MSEERVVKQLWKSFAALAALTQARSYMACMIDASKSLPNPEYVGLWHGFVASYTRPFSSSTRGRGLGSISTKIVPENFSKEHEFLMSARNVLVSHTDPDHLAADGLPSNRVLISVKDGVVTPEPNFIVPREDVIPRFYLLVDASLKLLRELIEDQKSILPEIEKLKDGRYYFDLGAEDSKERWRPISD